MMSSTNQKSLSDKPEKKHNEIDMDIGQVFVATDRGLFPLKSLSRAKLAGLANLSS